MEPLVNLFEALGAASLAAFWLPVGLWTFVALPVFLVMRAWKSAHPFVQYAGHAALLLALPLGLGLVAAFDLSMLASWPSGAGGRVLVDVPVPLSVEGGAAVGLPFSLPVPAAAGVLTLGALLVAAWRLLRLAGHAASLWRFRRALPVDAAAPLCRRVDEVARQLGLRRPVRTVVTPREVVPFTFGWRRPVVVLPAVLVADDEQLAMVLAHELVHVRRRDYLLHGLEQLVGAVFFVHPFVAVLRRAVAGYREMACDAEVLERTGCDRQRYARLLYRYVLPPHAPVAVGLAAAQHHFKTRLLAMKTYTDRPGRIRPFRLAFAVAALLFALSLGFVACSDVVDLNVNVPQEAERAAAGTGEALEVVEQMPEHEGGMVGLAQKLQQELKYPQIARLAGIEGKVMVSFVVDAKGNVRDAEVLRGIGGGCDEEAVRAVSTLKFAPGRQGGQPVAVRMAMPINFSLGQGAAPAQATPPPTSERTAAPAPASRLQPQLALASASLDRYVAQLGREDEC